MKTIKFKKWIITAIVSFILAITFLIISVIFGGSAFLNSIEMTGSEFETSVRNSINSGTNPFQDIIDGKFELNTGCINGSVTITDGNLQSTFTEECNQPNEVLSSIDTSNQEFTTNRQLINSELSALMTGDIFESKETLDNYLDNVIKYAENNNFDESRIIHETTDLIDDAFDTLESSEEEIFEQKYLDNKDIDDYVKQYLSQQL